MTIFIFLAYCNTLKKIWSFAMRRSLIAIVLATFMLSACSSVPGPSRTNSIGALGIAAIFGAAVIIGANN